PTKHWESFCRCQPTSRQREARCRVRHSCSDNKPIGFDHEHSRRRGLDIRVKSDISHHGDYPSSCSVRLDRTQGAERCNPAARTTHRLNERFLTIEINRPYTGCGISFRNLTQLPCLQIYRTGGSRNSVCIHLFLNRIKSLIIKFSELDSLPLRRMRL